MLKIPKRWWLINAHIVTSGILDITRITYDIRSRVPTLLANNNPYSVKVTNYVFKLELIL